LLIILAIPPTRIGFFIASTQSHRNLHRIASHFAQHRFASHRIARRTSHVFRTSHLIMQSSIIINHIIINNAIASPYIPPRGARLMPPTTGIPSVNHCKPARDLRSLTVANRGKPDERCVSLCRAL